jgi:hypothetical protein
MQNSTATNTISVPKSGWSRISPQTSAVAPSATPSRRGPGRSALVSSTAASTTIMPTLAYSEGCTRSGPSPYQDWAPWVAVPSGVSTAPSSSTMAPNTITA